MRILNYNMGNGSTKTDVEIPSLIIQQKNITTKESKYQDNEKKNLNIDKNFSNEIESSIVPKSNSVIQYFLSKKESSYVLEINQNKIEEKPFAVINEDDKDILFKNDGKSIPTGNFECLTENRKKIIRIFLSSTFSGIL
jgi:hypothetical protein